MHRPSPDAPPLAAMDAASVLASWQVEPVLVVALGAAAAVYAAGWRRMRARRAASAGLRQLAAFSAGLMALFVALASPLDVLADRSLAVHMAQHLVLLVVVPPLVLGGAPVAPVLMGLPRGRIRRTAARFAARAGARLRHPLVGLLALSLATWGWHVPAAFELALRSRGWHEAEHASFVVAGLLFWWPVVEARPGRRAWPAWMTVPYLLVADVQNTALAAILVFSGRIFYPSYGTGPGALDAQVAAGVLMWVPMSLAYLVPAAVFTVRWLSPGGSAGQRAGSRLAAA